MIERDGPGCAGTHLIIDLFGARRLDDLQHIKATLKRSVDAAGAKLLHMHVHRFAPNGGVSAVAVLAQGHLSIHSWPGAGYVAVDALMGGAARPQSAFEVVKRAFKPAKATVKEHVRAAPASVRRPRQPRRPAERTPVGEEKARTAA